MRILVIAALAVGVVAGASAPAFASPNLPVTVTVTGEPNNGVCVTVTSTVADPVKQCIDLGQP